MGDRVVGDGGSCQSLLFVKKKQKIKKRMGMGIRENTWWMKLEIIETDIEMSEIRNNYIE